ncbi:acyl carrier protein [Streptomyces sp. NPDC087844]|uniref:acyl carrier protein n=1 Tax=Streptomyces sp. NPDC087844 TaxID=3365805 RepID=UPI003812C8EC
MQQPEVTGNSGQTVLDSSELQERIAAAGAEERERILREVVRSQAADILDHTTIDDDSNFLEQGITSLKALELTRNLMSLTNIEIPLVAIIEHPTPSELAGYINGALIEDGGNG